MSNVPPAPVQRPTLRELWTDVLGRLGIRSIQIIAVLVLLWGVTYALIQLKLVVIPVLISVILAAAIGPLVNLLRRWGVPALLATWIALLAGLAILGAVITLIVIAVRREWSTLVDSAAGGLDELNNFVRTGPIPIDENQLQQARDSLVEFLTSSELGTGALAGAGAVVEVITSIFLIVVILFFFLKDGEKIWLFFLRPLQGYRRERALRIGQRSLEVLGGYVRGTAIIALVDAVAIGIALFILQVPLALPLAVIVFMGAFVPLVGATVAGILAALVALVANGPVVALIVVAVVIAVNQLEGDLLQPIVMGKSLRLHALVILLALAAGTILGGIIGAVLSVPIAAVAWAAVKTWNAPAPDPSAAGRVETS